jgi:glycosyltransferase involved in cell wall biosynthesis
MIGLSLASRLAARRWLWLHRKDFVCKRAERPRLLVDVSVIIRNDAQTGIQRVVRAVWSELCRRREAGFELVPVFASTGAGFREAPLDFLERKPELSYAPIARAGPGDRFVGLDLSAHLLPRYAKQLQKWREVGTTVHLMVYDLLPLLRPDWFRKPACRHFSRWFKLLQSLADQALCISPQVARDVRERLRYLPSDRVIDIRTLRMGANISATVPSTGISEDVRTLVKGLRFRRAILMVGTVEPRKGYDVALAAFEELWRTRGGDAPDLVIVGKPGWRMEGLQKRLREHPERQRRLFWLRSTSDEELALLYQVTNGLLMASYGEGFGLPLMEAAAHYRPTLARDLPVFKEQNIPATMFFSDDHPVALGQQVMQLLNAGARKTQTQHFLPTWNCCVDDLLDCLGLADKVLPKAETRAQAS